MMKPIIKMLFFIFFLSLCLPISAEGSDSLEGGIVTEIPRQMFLTNLPSTVFDAGSDPAQLDELISLLDGYTIIVTCGGETYELPMELSWNRDEIDFQTPGSYRLTGTILAPDGCTFADGVLTQLVMPIIIEESLSVETRTLTMLHNAAPLLVGNMLCTGSYESLKESEAFWKGFIQSIGAYNEYGDSAPLELDHLDDSRVILDTPGEYTIDFFLRLPAEYDGIYTLDPDISVLHMPIRVSDPERFDIWMSHATSLYFILHFLPRASETVRIFCTQSPSSLTWEELQQASWSLYDTTNGSAGCYSIPRPLTWYTYYYFYFEDETDRSNVLCIVDDGKEGISFSFEGNRDGGDAIGPPLTIPQITKPPFSSGDDPAPIEPSTEPSTKPSTDPAETETQHPSDTEPVLAADSTVTAIPPSGGVSSDITEDITGKMLLKMMEKGGGTARISNDGITATLKQESLSSYPIKENSEIKVTISSISDNQFILKLTVDGTAVQEVENTKIMIPYEMKETGATLYLVGQDQKEIPADSYDPALHVASFTVGKCGTYTIIEKGAAASADASAETFSEESSSAETVSETGVLSEVPEPVCTPAPDTPGKPSLTTILIISSVGVILAALGFFLFKKRMRR